METICEKGPQGTVEYAKAILFDVIPDMVDYTFTTTGKVSDKSPNTPVHNTLIKKFRSLLHLY